MQRLGVLSLLLSLTACPQDKDAESAGPDDTGGSSTTDASGSSTTDASGSTGSSTGALDDDCAFLPGKSFRADAGYECPLEPGKTCYDSIWFMEATYDYARYDYSQGGEYACQDGVIDETQLGKKAIGTIDAATGKLTWKDKTFTVNQ